MGYDVIYADPPWQYQQKTLRGGAEHHYPTLTDEDIYQLPVESLANENCVLFLWATYPKLPEALMTIDRWGFTYKTAAFVWVKQNRKSSGWFFGLGFWTRGNTEICLLAVKGKPKRSAANVSQLIVSPVERHSRKPALVRKRIEELMGDGSRIELFAREQVPGWECLGNEIDGLDIRKSIPR
ncbi:MAG: MT-A70 family methyltransferase [Lachnospiraceae bacterium]